MPRALVVSRRCGGIVVGTALLVATDSPAMARGPLPVAQQNAIVQQHCAVCHSDATPNGGLSLQHFDAAQASPALAAMMLSKLTSGVALDTLLAAASNPDAAALVA